MDPRTSQFREEFRKSVPAGYSGLRHAAIIVGFAILAIGIPALNLRAPIGWLEWLVVAATILGWNWVEWAGHLHVLHKPGNSALRRALYQRHAGTHHRFFTRDDYTLESTRDLRIVFFPWFALPAIVVMSLPFALLAALVVSANAGWLVVLTVGAQYFLFELFHLTAHLPDNAVLTRIPILNSMRRHHRAHHDPTIMATWNMNFTLPLWDWARGTGDLDRGLIGMTFNGPSDRFVRPRAAPGASQPTAASSAQASSSAAAAPSRTAADRPEA